MKIFKFALILPVLTIISADCRTMEKPATIEKEGEKTVVVEENNKFAMELYAKLRSAEGNLFFSPYSISTALAMTYAGARGQTEAQMAKTLNFPTVPGGTMTAQDILSKMHFHLAFGKIIKDLNERGAKDKYELKIANALWGQKNYGFLEEFLRLIKTNYDGQLNEVDFIKATETARQTINIWVERKTKNKIKNLIPKGTLDSMTRLVLTNAIYFKGNWERQFEKEKTKQAPFTLADGQKVDIEMMNQTARFDYMEAEGFQILELPYVDDELSMIILLPKEFDGLDEFEKMLTVENLHEWLGKMLNRKVIVSIPKFEMTSQFSLANVLKSMGITDAFSENADFSGMNGKKDLSISAVIHKAYVEVNEEGTEAAAATGVTMKLTSVLPDLTPVFKADHPFLFIIRDKNSDSILFIGRIMNPLLE